MRPVPEQKEVVQKVAIIAVSTPKPTPRPTPKPTPTPPPPHVLRVTPVVPLPQGKAAHKEAIKHLGAPRPKPPKLRHTKPIWDYYPMGGHGAGAGKGAGAGSLGNGTNGTGTGTSGNGAGGGAPCGAVDFTASGEPTYNPDTGMYERSNVKAIVHYQDGSSQTIDLDWTWHFRSRLDDPWVNSRAPMLFQFPPASQRASEPDAVQYIMQYSRASGTTKLKEDCPNIPPPSTPGP